MGKRVEKADCLRMWVWLVPLAAYGVFALWHLTSPGLYMDSVNPDYLGSWLARGSQKIPAWLYPDNLGFAQYKYPLLNSLYGGNLPAYLALVFFQIAGYGLEQLRLFHALLGAVALMSVYWGARQWTSSTALVAAVCVLLAVEPNFVFAWRTQYYLQLVPEIFLFAGLGQLGRHYATVRAGEVANNLLLWAGICLGFAAYCYFIFAFYAFAVSVVYLWTVRREAPFRMMVQSIVMGGLVGWLTYVYAHDVMMKNAGLHGYVEMLKGLQSTYGVVNPDQGGLAGRVALVAQRIGYLFGAKSMQREIFGDWATPHLTSLVHPFILLSGAGFTVFRLLRRSPDAGGSRQVEGRAGELVFARLALAIVLAHMVLGFIVGKALSLQHYVPLVPVFYAMLVPGFGWSWQQFASQSKVWYRAMMGALLVAIAVNVSLTSAFAIRIANYENTGWYTDAINVLAANLQHEGPDTVLLFPQWGYWMGAVTSLGPRFNVYEAKSLDQMKEKVEVDPWLQSQRSFALVLGPEAGDEQAMRASVAAFAAQTNLVVQKITPCVAHNGVDRLWIIEARRP